MKTVTIKPTSGQSFGMCLKLRHTYTTDVEIEILGKRGAFLVRISVDSRELRSAVEKMTGNLTLTTPNEADE